MSLRKLYFISTIVCLTSFGCSAQLKDVVRKTDKSSANNFLTDSVLSSIKGRYDLVVGYSIASNSTLPVQYYLVAFNQTSTKAYKYKVRQYATSQQKLFQLDSIAVDNSTRDSVLEVYNSDEGWSLKHNEDSSTGYCADFEKFAYCNISDGETYSFIVFTKKTGTASSFYAPQFFEKCCPGNDARKRFLALMKPVAKAFH
jgi:hypothetical protein